MDERPSVAFRQAKFMRQGTAITLPLGWFRKVLSPFLEGSHILVLYNQEPTISGRLMTHELCHVDQYAKWGFWKYYGKHIWARAKTARLSKIGIKIDWLAKDSDVEKPCYSRSRQVD